MRPQSSDPFETSEYAWIRGLYHWTGRSAFLSSLLILAIGAIAVVLAILAIGLLLNLMGR
jgi:hypothetical protein